METNLSTIQNSDRFKVSKKSLCHKCTNIEKTCNLRASIVCGTDSDVGLAFVMKCAHFNKPMEDKEDGER